MRHTKSGSAFTELVLETFRFNGCLLAAGDRLTKPLNLSSARWQVLGAIEHGPLPAAQIARNMGLARQSVQKLADRLERECLVRYEPNPNHKRAKLVCLTKKGRDVMRRLGKHQAAWANRSATAVPAEEIEAALAVTRRLRLAVEAGR